MSRKFAPISQDELLAKLNELWRKAAADELDEEEFAGGILHGMYTAPTSLSATIAQDLSKVDFDSENVSYDDSYHFLKELSGPRTLDNGLTFVGVQCGGDWEEPVFMILYWDGQQVRGYIPKDGNCWNHDTKQAIGNDEDADLDFLRRRVKELAREDDATMSVTGAKPTPEQLEVFDEEVDDKDVQDLAGYLYNVRRCTADIKARILPIGTPEPTKAKSGKVAKSDVAPRTQAKKMPGIIAVDFDGTCVVHEYPNLGRDCEGAAETLKQLADDYGVQLILWTMRDGKELAEAVRWFEERSIPLADVNVNSAQSTWTTSPKAYAHLYIDDAALGAPLRAGVGEERPYVDWQKVREILFG